MLLGERVAKSNKPKDVPDDVSPASSAPPTPTEDVEDAKIYIEHLLVPLPFKQKLDRIAFRVNQERKRKKLKKQPLGYFVVHYLSPLLDQLEKEMDQASPKE